MGSPTDCEGFYNSDQNFSWPIQYATGPLMFANDLFTHQDTLDLIRQTRAACDDDEELHCWLTGVPYSYWSQYDGIFYVFLELSGLSVIAGFAIAWIFLFVMLLFEGHYALGKIVCGSLIGALFIASTIIFSLVAVAGCRYVHTLLGSHCVLSHKHSFFLRVEIAFSQTCAAFLLV